MGLKDLQTVCLDFLKSIACFVKVKTIHVTHVIWSAMIDTNSCTSSHVRCQTATGLEILSEVINHSKDTVCSTPGTTMH